VEPITVLEMNAEPDRVVEPVDVFEMGDLLDVKEASRLLVFRELLVIKVVCVTGAVKVCRGLSEGVTDGPGGTEPVKDGDGVEQAVEEDVDETFIVLEPRDVRLWLEEVVTLFELGLLAEPVVELVDDAVALTLFVRVVEVVDVLEAVVGLPVCVLAIVLVGTTDPDTVLEVVEEAETVELGEALRDPFCVEVELVLGDIDLEEVVDAVIVPV